MKKGFTLAELLGVMVLLAAIALITIPLVSNVIKNGEMFTVGFLHPNPQ